MLTTHDNREYYRMLVNSPCVLQAHTEFGVEEIQARCYDISAKGVLVEGTNLAFSVADEVSLQIEPSNASLLPLNAVGRVVRVDVSKPNLHRVALEFIEIR